MEPLRWNLVKAGLGDKDYCNLCTATQRWISDSTNNGRAFTFKIAD